MRYIITRSSIINSCNIEGKLHLIMTENERPCTEAELFELLDNNGELCSRYFIELSTIEDIDRLGSKYDVDVLVSRNTMFNDYIALILYDEEIDPDIIRD